MKEEKIVFEAFPGDKIKDIKKTKKELNGFVFYSLLIILILFLFFVSSLINKKVLDYKDNRVSYIEKI